MSLETIVNTQSYPLSDTGFLDCCQNQLDANGVLVLPDFISEQALTQMQFEAEQGQAKAYFCAQNHSVYLTPENQDFPSSHPANRQVVSSKGCICDDDVAKDSPLRMLYDAPEFRAFVKHVTGEAALHPYADPLSSINIHYAERGQELG